MWLGFTRLQILDLLKRKGDWSFRLFFLTSNPRLEFIGQSLRRTVDLFKSADFLLSKLRRKVLLIGFFSR